MIIVFYQNYLFFLFISSVFSCLVREHNMRSAILTIYCNNAQKKENKNKS